MSSLTTKTPFARTPLGLVVNRFLHTRIGRIVGFAIGISGFNKIEGQVWRFQRYYNETEQLAKDEIVRPVTEGGALGIYRLDRKRLRTFNSRVDAGAALVASLISGTTLGGISAPAVAKYIALSTSSLTPAKGDTTLSGETAASGLARAIATMGTYTAPASLDGGASWVATKTFTNTSAGSVTVVSAAIFDAAASGNMLVEGNLSTSAVLAINDQLIINWTINV
ncbi:MAG TPA: hypothetical protein VNG73_08975 [Gemmatimonadaceae bacterium]|nr:hypothetical protein [Gemmatimonadaceae bacterium]